MYHVSMSQFKEYWHSTHQGELLESFLILEMVFNILYQSMKDMQSHMLSREFTWLVVILLNILNNSLLAEGTLSLLQLNLK